MLVMHDRCDSTADENGADVSQTQTFILRRALMPCQLGFGLL